MWPRDGNARAPARLVDQFAQFESVDRRPRRRDHVRREVRDILVLVHWNVVGRLLEESDQPGYQVLVILQVLVLHDRRNRVRESPRQISVINIQESG